MTNDADSLPESAKALREMLLAERARHAAEFAAVSQARDHAQGEMRRLMDIIKELQRHRFGRRSEQLDANQLMLAFEDVEQAIAAMEAAAEKNAKPRTKRAEQRKRNINRGALPLHLPREEIVIDIPNKTTPCGRAMRRIGEDVSERLEII